MTGKKKQLAIISIPVNFKVKDVAGGEGFEPSQSEPESDVLPLDDPPTY